MEPIDIVRIFILVEGLLTGVLSSLALYYFLRRSPVKKLVSHVQRVTYTYTAFVIYGCAETITHFGQPIRWQPFALLIVFSIGASAQIPLMRFERDTYNRTKGQ